MSVFTVSVYSIWPYFGEMTVLLLVVASPLFRAADTPPNPSGARISTLDGLRGFLALGVFFHHAAIYHGYLASARWELPPSRFYTLIGQGGVAMFFMITGFLFWSRIIREKGRTDWTRLYVGRVFRIAPLYLFAAVSALIIVFAKTGLTLNIPMITLVEELSRWLSLGFFWLTPVNGYSDAPLVLAGLTWTLQYEWFFYISLPVLALVVGQKKIHLSFITGMFVLSLSLLATHHGKMTPACVSFFLIGMSCGLLVHEGLIPRISNSLTSVAAGVLISAAFFVSDTAYTVSAVVLLGGAFYFIASGCSMFGLLTSRSARRLGDISYGIYLLQGLIFTVVFLAPGARELALLSPLGHWLVVLLCATLLIIVATISHVVIERPGIELGKRLTNAFERRLVGKSGAARNNLMAD